MEKGFYENKFRRDGIEMPIHCIYINCENNLSEKHIPHYHEYIEILYSIESDSLIYNNGKNIQFKTGDLVIVNSGERHVLIHNKYASYIVIKVLPEILYSSDQSVFEMKYMMPFIIENSKNKRFFSAEEIGSRYIHNIMAEIMKEWINADYGYELAIRANILKIFLWILRFWRDKNLDSIDMFDYSDETLRIVQSAIEFVSANYATINEKDVAEHCNLSYSYFSRTFKKVMNQSFSEYVNSYRITKAEQLLTSTDKPIREISDSLGFSTPSYFISLFKSKKNISPKQYRLSFAVKADKDN